MTTATRVTQPISQTHNAFSILLRGQRAWIVSLCLMLGLLGTVAGNPDLSAQAAPKPAAPAKTPTAPTGNRVFTAGVEENILPPGMYGQWNVQAVLVDTDYPPWFPPTSSDIWILQQDNGQVRLSNPITGAESAIRVDDVQGNRARFHHIYSSKKVTVIERPNLQVVGDTLTGETTIERIVSGLGGTALHRGRYQLQAVRMDVSSARVDLRSLPEVQTAPGRIRGTQPAPRFQIEPVRKGTEATRPFGN